MALFPIVSDKASFVTGVVAPTDTFKDGLRWAADKVRAAAGLTPAGFSQGLPVDVDGRLCLLDATAGLPADTTYSNGLPISAGQLCISVDAMATYSNGIPMSANGAVCI
ncbi:hypothetical protein [Achromobacter ruhlandii]|uniref:hypothetical protein n=1 Tax=Achromobacter ruhlandii TaxID=72557 RepID=UPI001581D384|nr:hypothetical protein [Achromobacter ruhlandii]